MKLIISLYVDEVDTLDDVDIEDDVDTELEVDTLEKIKEDHYLTFLWWAFKSRFLSLIIVGYLSYYYFSHKILLIHNYLDDVDRLDVDIDEDVDTELEVVTLQGKYSDYWEVFWTFLGQNVWDTKQKQFGY